MADAERQANPQWRALSGYLWRASALLAMGLAVGVAQAADGGDCGPALAGASCESVQTRLPGAIRSQSLLGLRSNSGSLWQTELLLEFNAASDRNPPVLRRPSDSRLTLAGRRGSWHAGVGGYLDFGSLTGLSRSGVNPYLGVGWSAVLHEESGRYQHSPYADWQTQVDSGEVGSVLTATVGADITLSERQIVDFGLHYSEYTDTGDISLRRLRSSFGSSGGADAWGMRLGFTHRFGR